MASKRTVSLEGLHGLLNQYRAEIQRDVSSRQGHIYFSRPVNKWILVRRKGDKAILEFHNDCPCDKV